MVRKKVRTRFLLFKKNPKGKEKGKNLILTLKKKKKNHSVRKKGKSPILTFEKKKKKKSHGK